MKCDYLGQIGGLSVTCAQNISPHTLEQKVDKQQNISQKVKQKQKNHSHTKIHCRVLHLTKGKPAHYELRFLPKILIRHSWLLADAGCALHIITATSYILLQTAGLLHFLQPCYTFLTRVFKKVAVVRPLSTRQPSVTQLRLVR